MVVKNSLYNLLGLALPLLVAIFAIPTLISILGIERFGLLTLMWALVSYLGILDLGLGRALTFFISKKLNNEENLNSLISTGIISMTILGVVLGVLLLTSSPFWIPKLEVKEISYNEIQASLLVLCCMIPLVVLSSGARGGLEALEEFKLINLLRIPFGAYTFIGPLFTAMIYGPDLFSVSISLILGRATLVLLQLYFLRKRVSFSLSTFDTKLLKQLLSYGGWISLSNMLSQMMGYLDRFLIAFIIGISLVTYYVVPHELITKLWLIPGAITAVAFPRFVKLLNSGFHSDVRRLYWFSVLAILIAVGFCSLIVFLFSYEILNLWISEEMAIQGSLLLKIFSVGIVINSIAHIPFTLIQSYGRSDLTAYVNLIQFPIYIGVLYYLITHYGVVGAASGWLLRMLLDSVINFIIAQNLLRDRND